jgi:ATP sulfurylase
MVNFSQLLNEFSVNSFDLSHHGPVSSLFHGITDKVCGAQHCMAKKKTALR